MPVVTRPEWASYTYAGPVRDLALAGGLLWAASDGGLVVWDGAGNAARFNTEHGLSANRVTSVALGLDGAVWAGTVSGLSRYDGRDWRRFGTDDGLPDAAIRDVTVDRDGYVWAATAAGLARYDGRRWQVFRSTGLGAALPSDNVLALAVDRANRVWAGTDAGLARLERGSWRVFTTTDGLPDATVTALAAGPGDVLWAATPAGLVRTDGTAFDTFLPGAAVSGIVSVFSVAAMTPLPDGTILVAVGEEAGRLLRFDPDTGRAETIGARPSDVDAPVSALLADESGGVWAGAGDAVWRVDAPDAALAGPSDLPSLTVNDMALAANGLWLATDQGVSRFDGRWQSYNAGGGLADNDARRLAVAPDGALWVAFETPLRGLSRYAGDQWQTAVCPTAAPAGKRVFAAAQTPGTLWFATEAGVSRFDGREWVAYGLRDGLPDGPILALVADGETVWAGGAGGVARYDGRGWQLIASTPTELLAIAPGGVAWAWGGGRLWQPDREPGVELPLPTAVRGLAASGAAAWLATADGVLRYDDGWTVFTPSDGLPSGDVTAISVANDQVWAAASSPEGAIDLVWFDGARWQPHPSRDPAAEQLVDNIVRDVATTPDGAMWLATPAGVNGYRDGRWTAYTVADGLPGDDVRAVAATLDAVWAATGEGLARFDGRAWAPFGAPSPEQAGPPVAALAVAPDGALWMALDAGWPGGLRAWNGREWIVAPLPAPDAVARQLAFAPDGTLVALIEAGGQTSLGFYDGRDWIWPAATDRPLRVDRFAIAPDGTLWVTGSTPLSGGRPGESLVAAFEIGPDGVGREMGRFTAPQPGDFAAPGFVSGGAVAPFAFAPDGRVFAGGAGVVYVFAPGGTLELEATLELPLPFSRHTFDVALGTGGELWVGTERGAAVLSEDTWATYYAPARTPEWWGSARALLPRPDGGILLGTTGGGVGLYTGRAYDGVLRPSQGPREWVGAFHPVTSVVLDENGTLWAASDGGGVGRFDRGAWDVLTPNPVLSATTGALVVGDRTAWLGTDTGWTTVGNLSGGGCRFETVEAGAAVGAALSDGADQVWLATATDGAIRIEDGRAARELEGAALAAAALGPNGDLWFANHRQPWLTRYRAGEWTRLPLDLRVVAPDSVAALSVAPNLELWLGSREGLVRFGGGQWSKLTTADGLADNNVSRVIIAPDGTVWAATAGGVSRFEP